VNLVVAFIEDRRLGLAAFGALGIVAGSTLPWIQVSQPLIGNATGYGLQDDGKITIVLGVIALALVIAYARLRQRDLALASGLSAAGAAAFAAVFMADLPRNAARVIARVLAGDQAPVDPGQVASFPAHAGVGLFVVFAGAALLIVCVAALTIRAAGTSEPAQRSSA